MKMIEGHMFFEPAVNIPVWDIDPYDPKILANPLPYYTELRERGPFVYIPKYSVLACGRHNETKIVFSDWERFVSSRGVGLNDFKHGDPWRPPSIILEVDPPEHTKTRKVMAKALSPKSVKAFNEDFKSTANELIDKLVNQDSFELVEELAEAFPTKVFPKALGMKSTDSRRLVDYGAMVFNGTGPDNQLRRDAMSKAADIVPWINAACAEDRLTKDGLGALIYEAANSGEITSNEAMMLVRSFLSAGVDTTVTGIGNTMWCLAHNPDAFSILKEDPKMARTAFEEVLRYTSPVHSFCRTANVDTEVAGIKIAEGTKILCVLGAANMDPDKWENPNKFILDRKPIGHMAFGAGVHGCVGQNLARAELVAIMEAISERVSSIEIIKDAVWRPNNAIHAIDSMTLKFHKI